MDSLNFKDLNENLFQGILVVSCTAKTTTSDWLKRIIDNSKDKLNIEFQPVLENGLKLLKFDLGNFKHVEPIRCHLALLDNKYYTTQIYLVELDETLDFPEKFYEFIHGVIIYFDNNDENCLKEVDKWVQYIDLMENCAIRILSCETATEQNAVSRIDIQNYCIDKGFELVELMPITEDEEDKFNEDDDDECEDDFKETISFERLYKAIQAYVWPNLNYKEKHNVSTSYISKSSDEIIKKINKLDFNNSCDKNESQTIVSNSSSTKEVTNEILIEEDVEKFEDIFSKFSEIKEKASKLDEEERRKYAEQVAMAFWNSISDDKDEIASFSSDEDADPNHVYV